MVKDEPQSPMGSVSHTFLLYFLLNFLLIQILFLLLFLL